MNNPNPFVPKGSILEQQSKRRSRLKIAVFCVLVVGVAGLSAMLIDGCKREQPADTDTNTSPIDTNTTPTTSVTDTSPPPMTATSSIVTPPVVPPVVPPPVVPSTTEYVVVKGDTLATIAKAHGVKLKDLEAANPSVVPNKMKIGTKLQIPAPAASAVAPTAAGTGVDDGEETYTVKSGDVLAKIAKNQGVKLKDLEAANPTVDPNHIKVGQKLKIPAKAEASAAAPAPGSVTPLPAIGTPPSSATSTN